MTALRRRHFLEGVFGSLATPLLIAGGPARAAPAGYHVKIASNQGIENATLQQLMRDRGFFDALGIGAEIVESATIAGPTEDLIEDRADICMISAYVGVLPAIERGAALRLVGAAMLLPALGCYSSVAKLHRVEDLRGHTIGIGGTGGLLHILSVALLAKKQIDTEEVRFVNVGSNAQVYAAVANGTVDAGLSGLAASSDRSGTKILEGGRLWEELPEYTYQPAYASVRAIRDKPEALARCLAAYLWLFRFLSSPTSRSAYLNARRGAGAGESAVEGAAVWEFIRRVQPYALNTGLSPRRVAYLQELNVQMGLQRNVLPFDEVADMSLARRARRFMV